MRENRTDLGDHFSEGARRLWLELEKRPSQSAMARELAVSTGQLTRWLYGDRRPSATSSASIQSVLDIPAGLFGVPPLCAFTPPAAVAYEARREDAPLVSRKRGSRGGKAA